MNDWWERLRETFGSTFSAQTYFIIAKPKPSKLSWEISQFHDLKELQQAAGDGPTDTLQHLLQPQWEKRKYADIDQSLHAQPIGHRDIGLL